MKHLDKLKHFAACFVGSLFFGFGFGIGAGVCKEWCDELYGGKWDWYDLIADIIGTVIGGLLHWLIVSSYYKAQCV